MISVIIPTCNRVELLAKCLECLSPLNQGTSLDYEIIVTDDSYANNAQELIKQNFPWVKWIVGPKKGPAANRNNGAKEANGEWLLFIDDDCLPNKYILKEYTNAINSNEDILVFEGSTSADRPQSSFGEESPINETGGYLWSCNFMIEKCLFHDSLRGFDEQFPYAAMEDVDLAYRLQKANISSHFVKSASVIHPWRNQKNLYRIMLNRFKSTLYFLNKHPEKRKTINSMFFLRGAYQSFFKNGITKAYNYRFRGFFSMIIESLMKVYFSLYLLLF
jgi:GT2 family glycosyltransferase